MKFWLERRWGARKCAEEMARGGERVTGCASVSLGLGRRRRRCMPRGQKTGMARYPACMRADMICISEGMAATSASILLVEDDASLRRSLRDFLKDHGYQPHTAGTMREAWETLRAIGPAVCLLDLNLPDGSGLDLLRRIVDEGLPVRVIVMTAFPLGHLQPRYPSETLVAWLTKPVAPMALLEAVERAAGRSQMLNE